MAQKNASPTKKQMEIIKANGLTPADWVVVKELPHSLIVRNRGTGAFEVTQKWTL